MPDMFTKAQRSRIMSKIKSGHTVPEVLFRKALFRKGFRYSLNNKKLPGKPDLVLPKYKTLIFVHGCFWHHHKNCNFARIPKSNIKFWKAKILGNVSRDALNRKRLKNIGWQVITVWECDVKSHLEKTINKVIKILNNK